MLSPSARGAALYQQTAVQCGTPLELVVKLYDAAIKNVVKARDGLRAGDLVAKKDGVSRAMAIVAELRSSLDMAKGGDIAVSLDRLYAYLTDRLIDANIKKDPNGFDEVYRLLVPLRDAWQQVASGAGLPKGTA
jgi:flagellar secretion chaperone FliS